MSFCDSVSFTFLYTLLKLDEAIFACMRPFLK